ncbi:nitrilase-related carbon-nitrogen hydrolase [Coprothermobacter platensis]|uniref:nitrilase-related carbon-nitrogen hydrolase n=1 Tax=Coprothermobacter platensis TaxID=108819 RepID=UPI0003718BFA|nr:nitrilase-related carbon-nitrogen hydrolase [Coprothermobacter platensis]
MKIGYVQFKPRFGDKAYNISKMVQMGEQLDADVIVFPELANTGYVFKHQKELEQLSEPMDGPSVQTMQELAIKKNALVTFGFAEHYNGSFYNSAAAITPDGQVRVYRKVHLFNEEKRFFRRGTEFFTFEWRETIFGMIICFDWMFPEAMRTLTLMGAQVILHPANLVLPYCQDAMITRCIENRVFEVTANRVGMERGLKFTGMSQITAPGGVVLHRGTKSKEEAVAVDIDPKQALEKRINRYNDLIKDRFPEAYRMN